MPEVIIKYKKFKTFKMLAFLSEYLEFSITTLKKKKSKKIYHINGVAIEKGDSSIDIKELQKIFSHQNYKTNNLRLPSWKRK